MGSGDKMPVGTQFSVIFVEAEVVDIEPIFLLGSRPIGKIMNFFDVRKLFFYPVISGVSSRVVQIN
jgi:hypothetical protein